MLPSVARTDPTYDSDKMWRGPVWINTNYFFIEALQQIGEFDLAKTIREKTLKLIMNNSGLYEYYNSETGKPGKNASPIFSWTAALFIDLSILASRELNVNKQ
jgi:glycogen debranching enzyme